jgi:chromosome segregation ATPase
MAGRDYNRSRYYTRSQQLSEQRDDINTIIKLKQEVRTMTDREQVLQEHLEDLTIERNELLTRVHALESEVTRLERELANRG